MELGDFFMYLNGPFLVVSLHHSKANEAIHLTGISPDIMAWNSETWLLSLKSVESYWRSVAGEDLVQTLRALLDKMLDQETLPHIGRASCYRATYAHNPWRALLLHRNMEERHINGLVGETSQMALKLFTQIRWDQLWTLGREVCSHFCEIKQKSESKKLEKVLNLMESSFAGLGLKYPGSLSNLPHTQIERRFSDWGMRLWEWTWWSPEKDIKQAYFPWKTWESPKLYEVFHDLEEDINQWNLVEEKLRLDLVKLANALPSYLRVLEMNWCVDLDQDTQLIVPILFRSPMNLSLDLPDSKVILKQIYHGFWGTLDSSIEKNDDKLGLKSWYLKVTKYVLARQELKSLFSDTDRSHEVEILSNRLIVPLLRFELSDDPWPEFSFKPAKIKESVTHHTDFRSLDRPLFLWKTPVPAKEPKTKRFLERVSNRWWEKGSFGRRDYYSSRDLEGQFHWMFKDQEGFWYQHGIFA
jgi:hypothetical protein